VGLWLVRGLVEAHGGSISVDSAAAQGATFTVVLPVDVASEAGVHEQA
jgi:signal transduction histidine kinase